MRNRFNRFSTRVLLTCDRGTTTFHRFTFRHTAYTVSICLLRTLKSHFQHTVNTVSTCPLRMPLSARQRRLWVSFGPPAASICLFRHDGVVQMPLSARRRRLHASFGTMASSICLSRHDRVVYMPLSAGQRRHYASFSVV